MAGRHSRRMRNDWHNGSTAVKLTSIVVVGILVLVFMALMHDLRSDDSGNIPKPEKVSDTWDREEPSNGGTGTAPPPCEDEQGTGPKPCYWDGGQNGQGTAYVVLEDGTRIDVDTGEKLPKVK